MANAQPRYGGKTPKAQQANSSLLFIPEKYRDAAYIALLAIAVILFLGPALLTGGSFPASDNVASYSFDTYLKQARESGEFPLWIPSIFSGLPSYAALLTTGDRTWDFLAALYFGIAKFFGLLFSNDMARIAFHYIVYGAGMYALMRSKKHERFIAFATGFAAVFSTYIITWIMIGHNTKPIALACFPFILMFLEKLRHKFSLFHASALILAVHVLVESTHVQMAFYGGITFGLYLLAVLISSVLKKENITGVLRSSGILIVAGILAFGMSADRYLSVLEYKPYSTRGSAPIEQVKGKKQDEKGGFDYEYSTNWSFSPEETITFLVPNYYGFGKLEYKPRGAAKGQIVHSYWGQMPFTDAANYMGIGVLALALLGIIVFRRDVFIHYLIVLSLLSLLLSFGKNFPVIYDIFFYHVPGFNNFRAPMMALCVMQFAVPILFGFGLSAVSSWRGNLTDQNKKILLGILGGLVVLLISGFMVGQEGYFADMKSSQKVPEELFSFLYDSMKSDWIITSLLGIATIVLCYIYAQGMLGKGLFFSLFAILLIGDLWRVGARPMEVSKGDVFKTEFRTPEFVDFIKKDQSLYRVADYVYLSAGKTNVPAYFGLQNVHGYHSAKMRVYQDLLDVAGGAGGNAITNPFLLNLLNVKYMAAPQALFQGVQPVFESTMQMKEGAIPTLVYQNPGVLPRAFFVDSVQITDKLSILHHLRDGDFDARHLAYMEEKPAQQIQSAGPNAIARITDFRNHYIGIETEGNTGNSLLFMSELYYPISWHAYIDGKEVTTYKTNYAFRGIVVPPGKHKVEFRFIGEKFEQGRMISLIVNILTTLSLAIAIFMDRRKAMSGKDIKE